ncbi:hypothetical protein DPMN_087117 [Dreissena polymorpha]|uniref:Uncharacterized protein n=1 Tax=Dreissena polymorpha TaxID=45954 RepID=A0A9D4KS35_DREPO|nr:hypothetical protein DPMN_087117 [Dreissena polymorpha]
MHDTHFRRPYLAVFARIDALNHTQWPTIPMQLMISEDNDISSSHIFFLQLPFLSFLQAL